MLALDWSRGGGGKACWHWIGHVEGVGVEGKVTVVEGTALFFSRGRWNEWCDCEGDRVIFKEMVDCF